LETEEIIAAISEAANTIANPNWANTIALVLSLATVIMTGIIAYFQIKISKQHTDIAKQQNEISLFKERYLVYCEFQKIINVHAHIADDGATKKAQYCMQ